MGFTLNQINDGHALKVYKNMELGLLPTKFISIDAVNHAKMGKLGPCYQFSKM